MARKKKKFLMSNKEEMDALMANEAVLYYITFLGDAPVLKNEVTFTKRQAERHYVNLLNYTVDMLNKAKNLRERKDASLAFMSLHICPLRIH
jgi:hypothetical protein